MATTYGWAGKILRVDLTAGTCVSYPTTAFPVTDYSTGGTVTLDMRDYIGGRGIGYAVMAFEVPPGTKAHAPENRIIFGVGPITGSGSPSSGRTSITALHAVHKDELPDGGQMGGHWGPELKYAGFDAVVIQGKSVDGFGNLKPVWLRIEDDKVTLEDASNIWGTGIYFANNYIVNEMGPEAHVAAIGPSSEKLVRLSAVHCDRSHRGGGQASIMGAKGLKAIGVRGTGAVNIKADKKEWKKLVDYYMSLLGCNNQGVVAKFLQPWSEYSPGNTRWSGAPGVLWGASVPPRDLGNCPDSEHPMIDAPSPVNKIGMRTQKGYQDFSDEGMKRTVRMDGCHACPIRCHIAADNPQLLNYGVTRYNMNTCIGNGGIRSAYSNTKGDNPTSNPMLLAYMGNSLENDYGLWSDYGGMSDSFKEIYAATVPNPNFVEGGTEPATIPMLQKYLTAAEWTMLRTTQLWNSGKSPFGLFDAGDPRFLQFFVPYVAANKQYATPATNAYGQKVYGTLGFYYAMGPHRLAQGDPDSGFPGWPELQQMFQTESSISMFKMGHTKHHAIETQGMLGGAISMIQRNRDCNNHTHQNFSGNGLPAAVKVAIAQELFTRGESIFNAPDEGAGKTAWWDGTGGKITPFVMARAAFVAASMVNMELHNALTQCNYTLPVWASPLKSRNYRGDATLEAKTYQAITGVDLTTAKVYSPIIGGAPESYPSPEARMQMALETMALKVFTLYRAMVAIHMQKANPTSQYTVEATPYTVEGTPEWSQYHPLGVIPPGYGVPQLAATNLPGDGNNMRWSHDYAYPWCYSTEAGAGAPIVAGASGSNSTYLDIAGVGDTEAAKSMIYMQLGWDLDSGLPTKKLLNALDLGYMIAKMEEAGITVPSGVANT